MQNILYLLIIFPIESVLNIIYQLYRKLFWIDGIAIIMLSITVSIIALPLYNMAESKQNAERDIHKKMKKKLDDIKAVFRGTERHMIIRTYYRQNNYHPVYSLRSVLGLAIQVPLFIAAYHYLGHLESFKDASYYFIPNLSKPDGLLAIGGLTINVLPITMTVINLVSAGVYAKKLAARELIQLSGMALLFLVLLYNSPSGLVLFWTMNNVCSLVKNVIYLSERPGAVFKKTVYAFLLFLFSCTLLLHLPFFRTAAGLDGVRMSFWQIPRRSIIFGIVLAALPLLTFAVKRLSPLLERLGDDFNKTPAIRNKIFIGSCASLFLLTGLVIPSSLISSSTQDFSQSFVAATNPLIFLKTVSLQAFGFFILFPCAAYALFKERVKQNLTLITLCITATALVNTYIFRGDYGTILSNLKFDSPDLLVHGFAFTAMNVVSIVGLSALVIFALKKNYHQAIGNMLTVVILSCAIMVGINTVKILRHHGEYLKIFSGSTADPRSSQRLEPVFNFSKSKNNVLIVMLDKAIGSYFEYITRNDQSVKASMSGFVWYPNTVAFNGHTILAVPPLFGGYEYTPLEMNKRSDDPLVEKHNESLLVMPVLFRKEGYNAIVTDASYANYSDTPDNSIFTPYGIQGDLLINKYSARWIDGLMRQSAADLTSVTSSGDEEYRTFLEKNLINFSFFRTSPVSMRNLMYDNGFWNNSNLRYRTNKTLPTRLAANYSALHYLPLITKFDSNSNELIIMVNELTHDSYMFYGKDHTPGTGNLEDYRKKYNLPIEEPKSLGRFSVTAAAIKRLSEWFEVLKKNGVYNNTKIIIVSDHGGGVQTPSFDSITADKKNNRFYPKYHSLLLYKDFNDSAPMRVSHEFMTTADVPTLATSHLNNPVNPFTGKPFDNRSKKEGVHIVTTDIWRYGDHDKNTFIFSKDEIVTVKDNIFDRKNWHGVVK